MGSTKTENESNTLSGSVINSAQSSGNNEGNANQSIFRAGGEGSTLVKQEQITVPKNNFASGATSRVYKGMYTDENGTTHPVAVKEFVLAMTRRMQRKVDKEAKLLHTLNHPNVVRFYGRIEGTSSLVTEFMEKSISVNHEDVSINNVRQLLDELEQELPWHLRLKIALETAIGVSYLHDSGCIHCDLKSANVFLGEDEKRNWIVKIGDFREARAEHKDHLMSQLSCQDPMSNAVGTVPFIAPEVMCGGSSTKQSDVYSFAMLLIELLCPHRANPWADDCKLPCISAYLLQNKRPTLPDEVFNIPESILKRLLQLIKRCWNEDPLQRPHFTEIVKDLQSMSDFTQNDSITNMKATVDESTGTTDQIHYNDESNERDSVDMKIWNLTMHQGSALETFGDIAVSFEEAGSSLPKDLHADIEQQAFQLDGSNACTFFATTLAHNLDILSTSGNNTLNSENELKDFVETLITDLPKKINKIRDVSSYVTVEEAVGILKEASAVSDLKTDTLMNCFSDLNTSSGENTLREALKSLYQQRSAFAVYTCPPISFCVGCYNSVKDSTNATTFIVIDTHCIPSTVGGNGNGAVVQIRFHSRDMQKAASKMTTWIKRRLLCSGDGGKFQSMTIIRRDFDHLGPENEEEDNELCEALEKSLQKIDASTDFHQLGPENEEDDNDLCEAVEKSLQEIDASTVPVLETDCTSKADIGECNTAEKWITISELRVPEKKFYGLDIWLVSVIIR
ncbi:probable serine/threonine-protein kinase roco4 isoform X2 [Montipora capricornis]|uniref:probable serine/threonine-protein kinase roco4 isoform X2 n=1 Tax=Montipora capricornis TaxID=246305 RepID=UPI0035F13E52